MNYEIIAIVIGPLVAVFTVCMEYVKDMRIKLQDRKQRWLAGHYNSIQISIRNIVRNVHVKTKMIYNGGMQLSIGPEFKEGIYKIKITNNLEPLTVGNINAHLKFYSFHPRIMELYNRVDVYNNNLNNFYNKFIDFVQNDINTHFNGIKSVEYLPPDYECYRIDQLFHATIYYTLNQSDFKIFENKGDNNLKYYSVAYNNNGAYYGIFFSKLEKNAVLFKGSIIPNIISNFKDELINMEKLSSGINADLDILIQELLKISSDYNSGFPVKGECDNCKSIKNVKRLEELMPPN